MSGIKVSDLAYVRLRVPDVEKQTEFLTNFGLFPAHRDGSTQYMRPTDPVPYCYVIEEGPQRFLGFAFNAKSLSDLEALSRRHGAPVEKINAPGGGVRVRLKEPNGYDVDIVFGIAPAPAMDVRRQKINTGSEPLARRNELFRLDRGKPTPIKRLAHVVLGSPHVTQTVNWFVDHLGMIVSDHLRAGPNREKHIGSFIRLDEGETYVDHHAVFIIANPTPGLQHISFEVPDFDAVLADHHYLTHLNRYEHLWGIGRHLLGAQIFDYWSDPFGYAHEHWADSDRLTADVATNEWLAQDAMISQWGEEPPDSFKKAVP